MTSDREPPGLVFLRWADPRAHAGTEAASGGHTCLPGAACPPAGGLQWSCIKQAYWHHFPNIICSLHVSVTFYSFVIWKHSTSTGHSTWAQNTLSSHMHTGRSPGQVTRASEVPASTPTLCDPMACSPPGPSPTRFSRQEHWCGLPCPPPGELPDQGSSLHW